MQNKVTSNLFFIVGVSTKYKNLVFKNRREKKKKKKKKGVHLAHTDL